MNVGVLALQGDFAEHLAVIERLGASGREVRLAHELEGLEGLIIPGGESTTMAKLAIRFDLMDPLREFGRQRPIWGTCAGAIFLARDAKRDQPLLGLMDITVERNAFGRQADSFEVDLSIPILENPETPLHAVFIRAPIIERVGTGVEVLARLPDGSNGKGGRIVAARQGGLLATSFHPELGQDTRFHRAFLGMIRDRENAP